jgi:ArsR family transcriptional regulator
MMDYTSCAAACNVLSDETRLKIVDMLSCGEMCACDLLEHLEISQSTLSYHMKALTGCGLVLAEKQGPWMRYRLGAARFEELIRYIGHLSTEKENCICGAVKRNRVNDIKVNEQMEEKK